MIEIIKYPDQSSYVKEEKFLPNITFRINNYEDLWHLNQYVDVCNHNGYTPTITIPCLLDAQADRRFNTNESNGLKLVLNFLKNMNANFIIFHPHNSEIVEAILENKVDIIDNTNFINKVLKNIIETENSEKPLHYLQNIILMSSDAGGFKPLMKLCDKLNWQGETLSASKSRTYNSVTNKSELVQILNCKDLEGKDVLIIDDICVYGGTFKGLSKLLKERNCGKLYLAVSHITVANLGEDPVTNYFDKVFTTNSKFDQYDWGTLQGNGNPTNLEIIKIF